MCVSVYVCRQKGGEAEEEKEVVGEKGKESSANFFFFGEKSFAYQFN